MSSNESTATETSSVQLAAIDIENYNTDELTALQDALAEELDRRADDSNLDEAERVELVNGQFVRWRALSAHPNLKAVKPWILRVTGTHDQYGVDGDWLPKQQIDRKYHMNIEALSEGDIMPCFAAD